VTRPTVGGVAGGLLVAHVDDADAHVEAAVVDVLDVPSAEGEEVRHALDLEGARYEVTAGFHRHVRRFRVRVGLRSHRDDGFAAR
jgi:hypothetical protein